LRADVVRGGTIRVGDMITVTSEKIVPVSPSANG